MTAASPYDVKATVADPGLAVKRVRSTRRASTPFGERPAEPLATSAFLHERVVLPMARIDIPRDVNTVSRPVLQTDHPFRRSRVSRFLESPTDLTFPVADTGTSTTAPASAVPASESGHKNYGDGHETARWRT